MLGWIIFGGIILLIVLLLMQSVKATICYENGKLDFKVKFLFITIFPLKPRKPKKNKQKKKAEAASKNEKNEQVEAPEPLTEEVPKKAEYESENKPKTRKNSATKPKKSGFDFDLEMIMDYVRNASPPVKRLFKKIRVRDLYIDYVVGTDDAAKTAIKYGSICAVIYPVIEWLTTYFSVQAREVKINADFSRETDDIFAYCVIKLRLGTALFCVIWFLIKFSKVYLKYNHTQPKKPVKASKKKG